MTMQVGMVGTDGVLIASDTKWTNTPSTIRGEYRHTFNSSKIITDDSRGIAVSYARNMETARHIASSIISELSDDEIKDPIQPIEVIGKRVLSTAGERIDAQCLIAFTRPVPRLFLFQFARVVGQWGPLCQEMDAKALAGDCFNAAIFLGRKILSATPNS